MLRSFLILCWVEMFVNYLLVKSCNDDVCWSGEYIDKFLFLIVNGLFFKCC